MCHRNGTTADENIVEVWNGLGVDGEGGVTVGHFIYNFFNLKNLTHAPRHLGKSSQHKKNVSFHTLVCTSTVVDG